MSDHIILTVNGLVVYDSGTVNPPDPPNPNPPQPPDDGFPPVNQGPTLPGMGWDQQGQPVLVQAAAQSYLISPAAAWYTTPPTYLQFSGGYSPSAGTTPAWVRYTVNGTSMVFQGSNQSWDTYGGLTVPAAPFLLTVEMFDANKQPIGNPYGVAAQINHTP